MFFGGINGFNAFFPEHIKENLIPPHVAITDIQLFNKSLEIDPDGILKADPARVKEIVLDYSHNNLTIKFSALHYTNPEANTYRYMMENSNEDKLVEAGTRKEAYYTNLAPGEYIFRVYGSNADGVESEATSLKIIVTPPFWETIWFRTILAVIIVALLLMAYKWRINSIKEQKAKLVSMVEMRTKTISHQKERIESQKAALEKEKEKAETLLANILPAETAEELKNKGKARTRNYRRVSVMFTDFKGFTKIAERMRPQELVRQLDRYFKRFDEIIEKNHIEKIKTIGDSYMAAGGVPLRDKENPVRTVLAALEIQWTVKKLQEEFTEDKEDPWELRVGIHTGEVIAGVIGTKRIAYDIWGNTVNVASRLETSSEPGKVNISGKTFSFVEPFFECTYRGKIQAKNKGHIAMYFVDRIKPALSEDKDGYFPNKRFWDYVNLHIYSNINYMKAERHIMRILKKKLSPSLHYHGIHHTHDVVEAVERIAIMEGVVDEDIFVLKSAATYHDAGFVEQYDANEPVGARMAAEILPKYGYTQAQVDQVEKLIYATIIPHNPKSHLEEIICDADLDYLGRDDFHQISDTLKRELMEHGKIESERLWDEIQVKFLTMHKYFTKSSIETRQAKKMKHLEEIKQRLKEDNYKS